MRKVSARLTRLLAAAGPALFGLGVLNAFAEYRYAIWRVYIDSGIHVQHLHHPMNAVWRVLVGLALLCLAAALICGTVDVIRMAMARQALRRPTSLFCLL